MLYYAVTVRFGEKSECACVHMCTCECIYVYRVFGIFMCSLVCFMFGSSCNISLDGFMYFSGIIAMQNYVLCIKFAY